METTTEGNIINQLLLSSDDNAVVNNIPAMLKSLEEGVGDDIYEAFSRLEFYRDIAVYNNAKTKEIVVYILMLKLSSNINLQEIEENTHANFSLAETLKYNNLVKLINQVNDPKAQNDLKQALENVEHSIVRIASSIGGKSQQDEIAIQGSALARPKVKQDNQDEALVSRIAEYKRIVLGGVKSEEDLKSNAEKTTAAEAQKTNGFTKLEPAEKLWLIGHELLRRLGLSETNILSLLPIENKITNPDLLEGSYTDTYIAIEKGLWKLCQNILTKITLEQPEQANLAFETELNHLLGQIHICMQNKSVYLIIERNYDFMPTHNINDLASVNKINIAFNEVIAKKGNIDEWYKYVVLALQTIGESEGQKSKLKDILFKITMAQQSSPSNSEIVPRTSIPLKDEEFSYFV